MELSIFRTLFIYRELLFAWTRRTINSRYQQSILGGLWAILQPVSSVAIFTVIFTLFIPVNTSGIPYVLFSYTAMVPWTFFSTSIVDMVDSLVSNMTLISKIYFPREILPVAVLLARSLDFGIAGGVLALLMLFYQVHISINGLLFFPGILLVQVALTMGLGLFGAALNIFYRDVRHLFALGLQIWLYATPIIYPVSLVPERLRPYYFLNPMTGVIEAYRDILLRGEAPGTYLFISIFISLVIFIIGYSFFKRVEFQFADVV